MPLRGVFDFSFGNSVLFLDSVIDFSRCRNMIKGLEHGGSFLVKSGRDDWGSSELELSGAMGRCMRRSHFS